MSESERLKKFLIDYPCVSTAEDNFIESIAADLADHLLANGVIVPPCKVGDTVYAPKGNGEIAEGIVQSIHQNLVRNERGRWIATVWFADFYANSKEAGFECGTHLYLPFEEFGKTVFRSRELAEKALAERSGK